MPEKSGPVSSGAAVVRVFRCKCRFATWFVAVATQDLPFECLGCGQTRAKGLVLRCPSCGTMSCGPCFERSAHEMIVSKDALKQAD